MVAGGLNAKRSRRGSGGGGRRNAWTRKIGERPGIIRERGLEEAGGYDSEGGGGGLAESVWRRGKSWRRYNRVGGRGNYDGVGIIMVKSSI